MLSTIKNENKNKESKIQEKLFSLIDSNSSFIFNAGAGAGKTYALVQSLKYIIKRYGKQLAKHNQKIICITYTNVATQKIKEDLGYSDLVMVSTIHERIWELIKNHQKELVTIHKSKLTKEIEKISYDLNSNEKYKQYQELSDELKNNFSKIMLKNKDLFYKKQEKRAPEFKSAFLPILEHFPEEVLKNVKKFQAFVKLIYKLDNYTKCIKSIEEKKDKFKKVKYNVIYNRDHLHRMRISHDTLLEYGKEIIEKYNLLQQIIIDKYPYFLVDEYQDTNEKVVEILFILSQYSSVIQHPFLIGYFGDSAQNIYEDGVGGDIKADPLLEKVYKEYNRRSCKEIIDVINNIRDDEIIQTSIYEDCVGGSVEFHTGTREDIEEFIKTYVEKWKISENNKLHCFVLTNRTAADYSGFGDIYKFFEQTPKYKQNYQQLSIEVLSDNKSQLGKIPLFLLGLLELRYKLYNGDTLIKELFSKDIYKNMNINSLRAFIRTLKELKGSTLMDYIGLLVELYKTNSDYGSFLGKLFDYEGFPNKSVIIYLLENLYPSIDNEQIEESKNQITEFLDINLSIFELWYEYTAGLFNKNIIYHTYHSTKGLEFENVIILMENAFGKRKQTYFKDYFIQLISDKKVISDSEGARNLLYVACSRAIKNLRVLYLDDISEFKDGIRKIFGKI